MGFVSVLFFEMPTSEARERNYQLCWLGFSHLRLCLYCLRHMNSGEESRRNGIIDWVPWAAWLGPFVSFLSWA